MKKKILLLFLFINSFLPAQNKKIDSLWQAYNTAIADTDKINKYANIGSYYIDTRNYTEAISIYQKIIKAYAKTYPQKGIDAESKIAFVCIMLEKYSQADSISKNMLAKSIKIKYNKGIGLANRNYGLSNTYQGLYKEAIEYHLKALKIWEDIKNLKLIYVSNSDVAVLFYYLTDYEKAAYYWENATKINPDKTSNSYINDCSNLAQAYIGLQKYDMALALLKNVLKYNSANKKSSNYINTEVAIAKIEFERKNYTEALIYYNKLLKLKEEGDTNQLGGLTDAAIFLNISAIYNEIGKPKEALDYALKGYQKAKEKNDGTEMVQSYDNLNIAYAHMGNYQKAYEFFQLYINGKDSTRQADDDKETKKQVYDLETKYQTEKKETENKLLNKQIEIQQIQSRQQKIFLLVAFVIVVLISFLLIVLYRQNKQKQKANIKLAEKNKIIEDQKILVDKAYETLHEKNKEVMDSINYASRIQRALITPEKYIASSLNKLMKHK